MSVKNRFIIRRRDKDQTLDDVVIESVGLIIGRLVGNDLALNDRNVARTHAGIKEIGNEFWLFNLSAANGTHLNGMLVDKAPLADGDVVQIGPFLIVVNYAQTALSLTVERALQVSAESYVTAQATGPSAGGEEASSTPIMRAPPGTRTLTPSGTRRLEGTGILRAVIPAADEQALDLFWKARRREVSKIAPTRQLAPQASWKKGRFQYHWRPTADLQTWPRKSYFILSILLVGFVSTLALFVYPSLYTPLRSPPYIPLEPTSTAGTVGGTSWSLASTVGVIPWLVWAGLIAIPVVGLFGLIVVVTVRERSRLKAMTLLTSNARDERRQTAASSDPIDEPTYPHPVVDPNLCIGCRACVEACPHDVLAVVEGIATPIASDQCMEDTGCTVECPTSPKACILINGTKPIMERPVPARNRRLMTNIDGLYMIGDVSGAPLIKNAINEGGRVIDCIIEDLQRAGLDAKAEYDVVIIGAGPAGLSAAVKAKQRGLRYVALEQDELISTITNYPAGKYVFFKPDVMEARGGIPLVGTGSSKESMIESWLSIMTNNDVKVNEEERCIGVRQEDGCFRVTTERWRLKEGAFYTARRVILAIGNNGIPMKLKVAGEELKITVQPEPVVATHCPKCGMARRHEQPFCVDCGAPLPIRRVPAYEDKKVRYELVNPSYFYGKKCMVVGVSNAAVEAAVELTGLTRDGDRLTFMCDNEVTLVVRSDFTGGLTLYNKMNLFDCIDAGRIKLLVNRAIKEIKSNEVILMDARWSDERERIQNDYIFVLIGREKSIRFLESMGIRVDNRSLR